MPGSAPVKNPRATSRYSLITTLAGAPPAIASSAVPRASAPAAPGRSVPAANLPAELPTACVDRVLLRAPRRARCGRTAAPRRRARGLPRSRRCRQFAQPMAHELVDHRLRVVLCLLALEQRLHRGDARGGPRSARAIVPMSRRRRVGAPRRSAAAPRRRLRRLCCGRPAGARLGLRQRVAGQQPGAERRCRTATPPASGRPSSSRQMNS